jgi:hypothetical protein
MKMPGEFFRDLFDSASDRGFSKLEHRNPKFETNSKSEFKTVKIRIANQLEGCGLVSSEFVLSFGSRRKGIFEDWDDVESVSTTRF